MISKVDQRIRKPSLDIDINKVIAVVGIILFLQNLYRIPIP